MKPPHRIRRPLVVLTALAMALLALSPGAASASLQPPSSDSFYTYSGPLGAVVPGTVLRSRSVPISLAGSPVTLSGTQVLYRTTNQLGQPDATVATIIHPSAPVGPVKLLAYQTFYDGVSDKCRPSYALQGGTAPSSTSNLDEAILLPYVEHGFTVVTSDYEGSVDAYGAEHQSGEQTLDAIRASEDQLGLTARQPVGLVGYSGGAIASEWAAELAPGYAPELNLLGVAAGGVPVDYTDVLRYIDGSADWSGAIPAVTLGLLRGYHIDPAQYLNARGLQIAAQVEQGCLNPTAYPGLKLEDILKPQYRNYTTVPTLARIFNDSIMGRGRTPTEPLLLGVGNADGTGDGVMVAKDVQQLAYEYCQRGVNVQFHVYPGSNHDEAAPQFEAQALQFLEQRYAGQAVSSGCAQITPGNPLTPLPAGAAAPIRTGKPRLRLRELGLSTRRHGLIVALSSTAGTLHAVTVQLRRGRRVVARASLARVGTRVRSIVLRVHGAAPRRGRYTLVATVAHATVIRRVLIVRRHR